VSEIERLITQMTQIVRIWNRHQPRSGEMIVAMENIIPGKSRRDDIIISPLRGLTNWIKHSSTIFTSAFGGVNQEAADA